MVHTRHVGPYLRDGALLVFDELVNYPAYREGEMRALYEWHQASGKCASGELLSTHMTEAFLCERNAVEVPGGPRVPGAAGEGDLRLPAAEPRGVQPEPDAGAAERRLPGPRGAAVSC